MYVTRTLILVVDRDNDFGVKGGVKTPVIGIDGCMLASMDLGTADPEDSDVNALLAAVNIYKDLKKEKRDVEIALICGDEKVGHKSDSILVDELNEVFEAVKPDGAILVGDGAEDEFIYPIISSRVPIDSVRRVYVKQAPSVEGTFYVISKTFKDPGKRKRFLVPLGGLLVLIAMVYLVEGIYAFYATGNNTYIFSLTAPVVVLILGILLVLYGYNVVDYIVDSFDEWNRGFHMGSISLTFTVLSYAMIVIGIVMGIYAVKDIIDNSALYLILVIISSALWPVVLGIMFNDFGHALAIYIEGADHKRNFMLRTISVFGIGFIIQGTVDFLKGYTGYGASDNFLALVEIAIGILFAMVASFLQASYRKYYRSMLEEQADES